MLFSVRWAYWRIDYSLAELNPTTKYWRIPSASTRSLFSRQVPFTSSLFSFLRDHDHYDCLLHFRSFEANTHHCFCETYGVRYFVVCWKRRDEKGWCWEGEEGRADGILQSFRFDQHRAICNYHPICVSARLAHNNQLPFRNDLRTFYGISVQVGCHLGTGSWIFV